MFLAVIENRWQDLAPPFAADSWWSSVIEAVMENGSLGFAPHFPPDN